MPPVEALALAACMHVRAEVQTSWSQATIFSGSVKSEATSKQLVTAFEDY